MLYLRIFVRKLRRKIEADPTQPHIIAHRAFCSPSLASATGWSRPIRRLPHQVQKSLRNTTTSGIRGPNNGRQPQSRLKT